MISICNKIAEVNIVALKNIGIYALHDTLALTTAKDDENRLFKIVAMHQHGCAAQICYLYVVGGRQREPFSAKAYIR